MNRTRLKSGAKITVTLVALVGAFEGLRTVAYRDPVGIPTICYGETRGVKMGDTATKEECKRMLGDRLIEFETKIRGCLLEPDKIPDGTYIAVLSFSYNVGVGAFCKSTMRKLLDKGRYAEACDELPKFVYARGIYLPGLAKRRAQEREICKKAGPWS